MGTVISRNVVDVISYTEDPDTGLLSSITIETSPTPQEMLYQTVADYFMNGTIALIPKTHLRTHSNSSRLNWHAYLRKVHHMSEISRLRSAAKLRASDLKCFDNDKFCYDLGTSAPGFIAEVRLQKSKSKNNLQSHFHQCSCFYQRSICSISITIVQKGKPMPHSSLCLVPVQKQNQAQIPYLRVWFLDAKTATRMPECRSHSGPLCIC
jgi:hypothetical protein